MPIHLLLRIVLLTIEVRTYFVFFTDLNPFVFKFLQIQLKRAKARLGKYFLYFPFFLTFEDGNGRTVFESILSFVWQDGIVSARFICYQT